MKEPVHLFWFRRDLRLQDNAGLYHALRAGLPVVPLFLFDRAILDELPDRDDARVTFIHRAVEALQAELVKRAGSSLVVRHGFPEQVFRDLLEEYDVRGVYTNDDYEPYARQRDRAIADLLQERGIGFHACKDQVLFEKDEIIKDDGRPYTIFTPYSRRWKSVLNDFYQASYPSESYLTRLLRQPPLSMPSLEEMGFLASSRTFPPRTWSPETILRYGASRDYPAHDGTTRLSVHLRFGTLSIRQLVREAGSLSGTFLNELIWRDFYHMILWHFPRVVSQSFKPEYDRIRWRNNEQEFQAWCEGATGYPIVDAGMRQLNQTGYMHNRVRMVVASFLTKHLLVDWRWGEAYFARKLLDFDLAANNGGWQWAAGSGCDAAPYFRVFNPYLQTRKFDPDLAYIRRWVPELEELTYPRPIVEHEAARRRCLEVYGAALKK
ncbi:MAG TPA: deoxyribodipyrimidine photo-lyase [Chitinophagaceae bacterium]|nr:deoxyribodipyrimidine photo-lyase [Chitinophagaceae bacterium]